MKTDYLKTARKLLLGGAFCGLTLLACESPVKYDYTVDRYKTALTPNSPKGFTNPNDPKRIFTLELQRSKWDQGRRAEVTITGEPATLRIGNTIELNVGTSPTVYYDATETSGEQPWVTIEDIIGARTSQTSDDTLYVMFNMPHRLPSDLY